VTPAPGIPRIKSGVSPGYAFRGNDANVT
jgi:hypothetical protein